LMAKKYKKQKNFFCFLPGSHLPGNTHTCEGPWRR
jgi:hypothetical protein